MAEPRPWSNDEKNYLLAEIIKQSSPLPTVLYNVVASINPQPRWEDLPLPHGRSLNQCRYVFDELRRSLPQPAFLANPYGPQTPLSAPPPGLKRPFQLEAPFPSGREIRPKPYPTAPSTGQPPAAEQPTKRRRGRPTKKEAEEKAKAAGAAGAAAPAASAAVEAGPAAPHAAPAPMVMPNLTTTPIMAAAIPTETSRPALAPTTRMPISAMLTPTAPHTTSSSSSSSGRRRRGRSTRSDPEGRGDVVGAEQHYESPYARAAVNLEDTPARAAVMRHREEQQQQQQRQQTPTLGPALSSASSGEPSRPTQGSSDVT